jgi:hypothetical protein
MRNLDEAADEIGDRKFDALPERVRLAPGELAGAAKEGLLPLSVGGVVGPKGCHDPERVGSAMAMRPAA